METIWNLLAQRWYVVCLRLPGLMEARRGEHGNNDLFFFIGVSAGNMDFFSWNGLTFGVQISAIYFYIFLFPLRACRIEQVEQDEKLDLNQES